jgi:hypothetical protein
MSRFCTRCGARNDGEAGFCEECGNALRPAVPAPSNPQSQLLPAVDHPAASAASARGRRAWLLPAVLGVVALTAVVGGFAWWWSAPAASAKAFAAALKGASGTSSIPSADLLCFANLPYDRPQINIGERDLNGRRWMDALASAGLYTAGQPVAGLFQQVIQYTPTPELAKWRRGARLCVAESWSVGEVKGGPFNPDKRGSRSIYRASVVWNAEGTAPWLSRLPAGQWLPGVRADGGSLTIESSQLFELQNRRWIPVAVANPGQVQREVVQAAASGPNSNATSADQEGALASLKKFFSGVSRNKLTGTYSDSLGFSEYTFKDDGTLLISAMGTEFERPYQIDGDKIKLLGPGGGLVLTLLSDGSIRGPMGQILTKQQK